MSARKPNFKFVSEIGNVVKAADRTAFRVMRRFGAYVMTVARRSMRPASRVKLNELPEDERKKIQAKKKRGEKVHLQFKPSEEGEPPRYIEKTLRKLLLFAYQPKTRGVVVGPERFRTKARDVPRILEEGGVSKYTWGPKKGQRKTIKARPYMGPALKQNLPKLPAMWRDAIKK